MLVLLDNTVLSNFAIVDRPHLLQSALGADIAIPEMVWVEFQTGIHRRKLPDRDWTWLQQLALSEAEMALYDLFSQKLNAGEAACLAIAMHRHGRVFTDDRDAREIAARYSIPFSGTLGILVQLIDLQKLTLAEGDALLTVMMKAGYYSPVGSLRLLL